MLREGVPITAPAALDSATSIEPRFKLPGLNENSSKYKLKDVSFLNNPENVCVFLSQTDTEHRDAQQSSGTALTSAERASMRWILQ